MAMASGFRYDKYSIGGVYVPKGDRRMMVWYMIHIDPAKMRQKLLSGAQISKMKKGLFNIQHRPTIEPDFDIPEGAFSQDKPATR